MPISEETRRIISLINQKEPLDFLAEKIKNAIHRELKNVPSERYPDIGTELYDYMRENFPRLGHMVKFKMNIHEKPFYYGSETYDDLMGKAECYPEYGEMARWRIKHVLRELPSHRIDFPENELIVRITCMHMEERDGRINWSFVDQTIKQLFDQSNECKTDNQILHEQAADLARTLLSETSSMPANEQYLTGHDHGYATTKQNPEFSSIVLYKLEQPKRKRIDYGNEALNQYMEHPDSFPEYGEKAREEIIKTFGSLPVDHPDFASTERATRIFIRKHEAQLANETVTEQLHTLITMLFDNNVEEDKKRILH